MFYAWRLLGARVLNFEVGKVWTVIFWAKIIVARDISFGKSTPVLFL